MLRQPKFDRGKPLQTSSWIGLLVLLVLASMACSLGRVGARSSNRTIWISRTLPTLTPTSSAEMLIAVATEPPPPQSEPPANSQVPAAEAIPTLAPTATAMLEAPAQPDTTSAPAPPDSLPSPTPDLAPTETLAAPTPTPPPGPSPSPEPNPVPGGSGWTFIGIQAAYDPDEDGVIMHGDMINNTGSAQAIIYLTGVLVDGQTQVTASVDDAAVYWPLKVVPPGGQVPFELISYDLQNVTDFNLSVISEPSSEPARQDFEFSDLAPSSKSDYYCMRGKLWNSGNPLSDNLLILVVIYDNQDHIINFGSFEESTPENILGEQALPFEVCTNSYKHQVARHELRAVGL